MKNNADKKIRSTRIYNKFQGGTIDSPLYLFKAFGLICKNKKGVESNKKK